MDKSSLFWSIMILLPSAVVCECTCDPTQSEDRNKAAALRYKLAAIASILAASALGVCLPVAGKRIPALSPERSFFFIVKAFAAGVILSTGFIHVLPDAFDSLTSPCLSGSPWGDFPFTGFIAMLSAIGTLMVDTYATSYYRRRSTVKVDGVGGAADVEGAVPVHTHATHGHAHGSVSMESNSGETELLRHRVISQVLLHAFFFFFVWIIGIFPKCNYNYNNMFSNLEKYVILFSPKYLFLRVN